MSDIKGKVLDWFAHGRVGLSSKSMALCAAGLGQDRDWGCNIPHDPDDFNRCLLLVNEIPEIKDSFGEIAKLSQEWGRIIKHWDAIEASFINEVGLNWCNGRSAPKTYDLMKLVIGDKL